MGLFTRRKVSAYHAVAGGFDVVCLHCRGNRFWQQRAKLSSGAAEFFDVAWASPETLILTCIQCGFRMAFLPNAVSLSPARDDV